MARKHVTDLMVCQAIADREQLLRRRDAPVPSLIGMLMERTGEPEKVCVRAIERTVERRYADYGVSIGAAFLEPKGRRLLEHEAAMARARAVDDLRNATQRAVDDLRNATQREVESAIRAALTAIPGASELDAFALTQRLMHRIMSDGHEAYYFDNTPLVLVHPLEVVEIDGRSVAQRRVERVL